MKIVFIRMVLGIFILCQSIVYADETVVETATINHSSYPNKGIDYLKDLVLKKAKLQASYRIYGEVLLSNTSFQDGKIHGEHIKNIAGGIVHIQGEPKFQNGRNLGDIQVTIKAYATDTDIKRYYEKTVYNEVSTDKQTSKKRKKKGFYGEWGGYTMDNRGGSTKTSITISSTGESKITFLSLGCGGDLLIKKKGTHHTEFKKLLNYGLNGCEDKTKVVLIKKSKNQLEYTEYFDGEKISHGILYREESE